MQRGHSGDRAEGLVRPLADPKPLALLNRSLVITTALAALIMAAAFWLSARNRSDDEWVMRSLAVRDQVTQTFNLVQSAETGQRGYLLTGRAAISAHTKWPSPNFRARLANCVI